MNAIALASNSQTNLYSDSFVLSIAGSGITFSKRFLYSEIKQQESTDFRAFVAGCLKLKLIAVTELNSF